MSRGLGAGCGFWSGGLDEGGEGGCVVGFVGGLGTAAGLAAVLSQPAPLAKFGLGTLFKRTVNVCDGGPLLPNGPLPPVFLPFRRATSFFVAWPETE